MDEARKEQIIQDVMAYLRKGGKLTTISKKGKPSAADKICEEAMRRLRAEKGADNG